MNQANIMQDQPMPPLEPDLDTYTDLSVGEILTRTREHYGQSLAQVEVNLRIRATQLEALEMGHIERLPGRVYAIGFVRAYSEYLGLDGDKMVHLFKAQTVGKRMKPDLHFPVQVSESKTPNIQIILFSLVALVLLIAYWTVNYTPTKYVEAIPPVPESLKKSSLAILTPIKAIAAPSNEGLTDTTAEDAKAVEAAPAPKINKMELVISEDSWVEIKNTKGEIVIRQVLKPGDKYIVPDEKGLLLSTGNAGGITVFVEGKKIRKLGQSTQVKRNVLLDPRAFSKAKN